MRQARKKLKGKKNSGLFFLMSGPETYLNELFQHSGL